MSYFFKETNLKRHILFGFFSLVSVTGLFTTFGFSNSSSVYERFHPIQKGYWSDDRASGSASALNFGYFGITIKKDRRSEMSIDDYFETKLKFESINSYGQILGTVTLKFFEANRLMTSGRNYVQLIFTAYVKSCNDRPLPGAPNRAKDSINDMLERWRSIRAIANFQKCLIKFESLSLADNFNQEYVDPKKINFPIENLSLTVLENGTINFVQDSYPYDWHILDDSFMSINLRPAAKQEYSSEQKLKMSQAKKAATELSEIIIEYGKDLNRLSNKPRDARHTLVNTLLDRKRKEVAGYFQAIDQGYSLLNINEKIQINQLILAANESVAIREQNLLNELELSYTIQSHIDNLGDDFE